MEQVTIRLEKRLDCGSSAAQRLRRAGELPGVMYGEGNEALSVRLREHDFAVIIARCGRTQLYRVESEDSQLDGALALVKEVQAEPLKGRTIHVDFLRVRRDRRISVTIPLLLSGECLAVKQGLAELNQSVYELEVECLPDEIPESLSIDISPLVLGHSLHVRDLEAPGGVLIKAAADLSLVSVVPKRGFEEEPAPTAEGEAGAAAEEKAEGSEEAESGSK